MPATLEVTIHDYEAGAEKTVTLTLSDEQIAEAVEKQKAQAALLKNKKEK